MSEHTAAPANAPAYESPKIGDPIEEEAAIYALASATDPHDDDELKRLRLAYLAGAIHAIDLCRRVWRS